MSFEFNPNEFKPVDDPLMGGSSFSYTPTVTWQPGFKDMRKYGVFTTAVYNRQGDKVFKGNIFDAGMGFPGMPWGQEDLYMFSDADPKKTYITPVFRCFIVGTRKRAIITDASEREHFYGVFTPKVERVEGKWSEHNQTMCIVPGLGINEPVILTSRGVIRSRSWSNDLSANFHDDRFPYGVMEQVTSVAARQGIPFSNLLVDLRGAWQVVENETIPNWIVSEHKGKVVGKFQNFTPFWAVAETEEDVQKGMPTTRIAGEETAKLLNEFQTDVVIPWVEQWPKRGPIGSVERVEEPAPVNAVPEEDDPIPF